MYLVAIAWFYVALMMSLAEAMSSQGSILGACITFILYGLLPIGIVLYIMGAPHRKRAGREARKRLELQEPEGQSASAGSTQGNDGDHAAAQALPPVREEP